MDEVTVYTDGGCSGNPGPGGWAFVVVHEGSKVARSGRAEATTNNRMELTAVIRALEYLQNDSSMQKTPVTLHTDSQYVQKGITSWIETWVRNGWRTSAKKPVRNQDLWKRLKSLADLLTVDWRWVKGHEGDELNEECDSLVKKEIFG